MFRKFLTILISVAVLSISGTAMADKAEKKRQKILTMRQEVLVELFETRPQAKAEIDSAEGYAVFSNIGVQVLLIGVGGGRGVVHDNKSGIDTYMKMGTASVGIGLGVKDFRAVFIFHDRKALDSFINKGWDFSGEADAAARSGEKGGEIGEGASFRKKVSVYQFTKNGLVLQASLHGTKYWKNKKLNGD
jgi:lipid-binding SYLF domain-containing protein